MIVTTVVYAENRELGVRIFPSNHPGARTEHDIRIHINRMRFARGLRISDMPVWYVGDSREVLVGRWNQWLADCRAPYSESQWLPEFGRCEELYNRAIETIVPWQANYQGNIRIE